MKTFVFCFIIFFGFGILSIVFLSNWDIPVSTKNITKVVPDEKFR